MSNLFQIEQEYLELIAKLEDRIAGMEEGEDVEEIAADEIKALEINKEELEKKLKAYYYIIKMKESEMTLIDDEIARLRTIKETKNNLVDRLKKQVDGALRLFGEKTDSGGYRLKFDKLSIWNVFHKPVRLDDDFSDDRFINYAIKDKFKVKDIEQITKALNIKLNVDSAPDKVGIKNALQAGEEINGASIDKDAAYVRFK